MYFLEVKNVTKRYAQHTALDNVSLSIEACKVFGLLGPNGAGKTSLIRIINRITGPDEGEIIFDGAPMSKKDIYRIGYLPEERGLYKKMKVGEQAIYLARLKGVSKVEATRRIKQWFDKFEIMPWWDKKVEELSKGMQQKIQFICTVIHDPELLIFDEPFSGFDPVNADLLKREILELKEKGRTVIFSTHNMQSVEEVCDNFALINKSKVVLQGNVEEVRKQYRTGFITLTYEGSLSDTELSAINPAEAQRTPKGGILRLQRAAQQNNRDLLQMLPAHISVTAFNEEIPSMHEIFIKNVKTAKENE